MYIGVDYELFIEDIIDVTEKSRLWIGLSFAIYLMSTKVVYKYYKNVNLYK
jgi:hypothetical protein